MIVKHKHDSLINIIHYLATWRLPRTISYSYPRVAAIRIDVDSAEENPITTTCTVPTPVQVCPTYAFCGQSLRKWQPFTSRRQIWTEPTASEKKMAPDTIHSTPLIDLRVHTQFLSQVNKWSSRLKSSFCRWQVTRLTRPISPVCNRYVQYLLAGTNPSVLNRHRQGLQPWRYRLSTYHSPTFPTNCLSFPPKGPARS
jgi:hypothetical protein